MTLRPYKRIKELVSKLQNLEKRYKEKEEVTDILSEDLTELKNTNESLQERADTAETELARLNDQLTKSSERTQVTIAFDDSLQNIIPTFRYKGDKTFEKLVEINALDDRSQGSDHAIQLALLNLSYEAILQILEAYNPPLRSDDD